MNYTENDTLMDSSLSAKIRQRIADYESGKVHRMNAGESTDDFLNRMVDEP